MRTLRINYTHYDEEQQDDPVFLEILERHLNRTGPELATSKQIEESQKEYGMSIYPEARRFSENYKKQQLQEIGRYQEDYKEIVNKAIQTSAYFLAKKDNFQKSPEYYWLEAERNL